MIKRRSVRIKVLQAVYGFEFGDGLPLEHFRKELKRRIHGIKEIYLYNLLLIKALCRMVDRESEFLAVKYLKSSSDRTFNTKLLSNVFFQYLDTDERIRGDVAGLPLEELLDEALLSIWYKDLKAEDRYVQYLDNPSQFNPASDTEFMEWLYTDFLLEREDLHHHLEEIWSNWIDDAQMITGNVRQTIQKSRNRLALVTDKPGYREKMAELADFGIELLNQTVQGKEFQVELVGTRLKNWDIERLASTDMLIMRMALAEMMYFPSIPVKVTINEYIDIAREYSTPKSREFINGVLDNLYRELSVKGLVVKDERGLKES